MVTFEGQLHLHHSRDTSNGRETVEFPPILASSGDADHARLQV